MTPGRFEQAGPDSSGQAGMGEEEYQAAVAQTAELAAQLPRIGVVGRRPPQGPSMPQRLFNHFRNPEAVLGTSVNRIKTATQLSKAAQIRLYACCEVHISCQTNA